MKPLPSALLFAACSSVSAQSLFVQPPAPAPQGLVGRAPDAAASLYGVSMFAVQPPKPRQYKVHDLVTIIVEETVKQSAQQETKADKTYATVVYRVVAGRTVVTPVRIGAADMSRTVISAGLKAGEKVVTGPYKVLDALAHDRDVDPQGADGKGEPESADRDRPPRGMGRHGRR